MDKIGFIGLGRMGKGMAANLRKKGFELMVHDINAAAVAELVALGATDGQSVAKIACGCIVITTPSIFRPGFGRCRTFSMVSRRSSVPSRAK